jgi:predicted RNA binding protein YcfA (HicA-like mRNA interferase family)
LGRLKPESFREVKRRLERAGFVEASQKSSHVKFVRRIGEVVDATIVPKQARGACRHLTQRSGSGAPHSRRLGTAPELDSEAILFGRSFSANPTYQPQEDAADAAS